MPVRIICFCMVCSLSMLAIISVSAAEDEKVYSIASYHIPLLVDDSEHGAFVLVLQEAAARAGFKYTLKLYPAKRAMRLFEDHEVIGLLPALYPTLGKDAALTCQIFTKKIHGFVRQGDVVPRMVQDLEGKRIGLIRGFSYPQSILVNENIEIDYADTTGSSLRKLVEKRIDVVVVDGYTAINAMRSMRLSPLDYDLSATLHSQPVFMAFQPTKEGRALAEVISKALTSMKKDGTHASIVPKID